ncbi:MAG: hypothetical protein ACQEXJ_11370 [Myxococcota bacterium]
MMLGSRWGLLVPMIVALCTASGCGATMDRHSGEDALRAGAVEIPLGKPVDDRASAPQGDHTDWKTFTLEQDAEVRVEIWWDDPGVEARVAVRDQFADAKVQADHREGRRKDVVGPVNLSAGQYFLEIVVTDGASVYTLEVHSSASTPPRPGF